MRLLKRLNKGHFVFLANVSWLIGDRLVRLTLGVVVSILLARYLQPQQFGEYSFALAIFTIFTALANLGLQSVMVRLLLGSAGREQDLLLAGFVLQLGAALISILLAAFTASFFTGVGTANFWVVAVVALSLIPKAGDVCRYFFEAKAQFKYPVIADNVSYLTASLLRLAFIYFEAPLIAFAWLFVLEIGISGLCLFILQRMHANFGASSVFSKEVAADLLTKSWPLLLSNLAIAVYMRLDQLLINYFMGSEAVGLFAAAMRLVEAWYLFPMAVVTALNPVMISSLLHDPTLHDKRYRTMLRLLAAATTAVCLVVTIFSPVIERVLYGHSYPGAGRILSISIWASVFVVVGVATNQWLVNRHLNGYIGFRTLCGLVTAVLANLILIPRYGPVGAAISLIVAQAASAFSIIIFPRARGAFRF